MAEKTEKSEKALRKIIKALGAGVKEELDAMGEKALRDAIVEAEARVVEIDHEKENDRTLNGVKERLKDLNGGYRDAKKAQTAKTKYAIHLLEQKGKV